MKSADVVKQLRAVLPSYTDIFNAKVEITSMSQTGTTVTAQLAAATEFKAGEQIVISGAIAPIAISSIIRTGDVALAVTATPHDITEGVFDTVALSGSNESEFNGTFPLLSAPNRTQFTFQVADSGATEATGSPLLDDPQSPLNYNGSQTVLADSSTDSVQFDLPYSGLLPSTAEADTSFVQHDMRITNSATLGRIMEMFTDHEMAVPWLFVVLEGTTISADRDSLNDTPTSAAKGSERRVQIYQDVSVYFFSPISDELSGADAADQAQDVAAALLKTLAFWSAPTDLSAEDDMGVRFIAHGGVGELINTAIYVHQFQFQQLTSIYREDTIEPEFDVAFRDINLSIQPNTGVNSLTASVNLDDYPLDQDLFYDFVLKAYDATTVNTTFELLPVRGNWNLALSRPDPSPGPKIIWTLPTLPSTEMALEFQISEMAAGATATVEFNESGSPFYTETFTSATSLIRKVFSGLNPGTYTVNVDIATVDPVDDKIIFSRLQLLENP